MKSAVAREVENFARVCLCREFQEIHLNFFVPQTRWFVSSSLLSPFFFSFFTHARALPHKESRSFPSLSLSLCFSVSLSVSGLSEPNPTQIKEEEEEEDHNVRSRGIASRSANGKNLPKNAPRARTALLDVPGDDRESDEGAREFARRGGETQGELVRIRTHEEGETDETDGRVVVARGAQRRGGDDESV